MSLSEASPRLPNQKSLGWYGTETQRVADVGTIKASIMEDLPLDVLVPIYNVQLGRLEAGASLVWEYAARHCL